MRSPIPNVHTLIILIALVWKLTIKGKIYKLLSTDHTD